MTVIQKVDWARPKGQTCAATFTNGHLKMPGAAHGRNNSSFDVSLAKTHFIVHSIGLLEASVGV
jgi:hypothetical protein